MEMNFKQFYLTEILDSKKNINLFRSKYNTNLDDQSIIAIFKQFNQVQSKVVIKDIFLYPSLNQLQKIISGYLNQEIPKNDRYQKIYQEAIKDKDVDVVLNNDIYLILLIKTKNASIKYGKGTKWCISMSESNPEFEEMDFGNVHPFNSWNRENNIYFIFDKRKSSKDPTYKCALLAPLPGRKIRWYDATDNADIEEDEKEMVLAPKEILTLNIFKNKDSFEYINSFKPDKNGNFEGSVQLWGLGLKEIPFNYNIITGGHFNCSNNKLTSLKGAPKEVGGGFYCSFNNLKSLEESPKVLSGDFECDHNQLTTLEGAPKEIDGYFDCSFNDLLTLKEIPQKIGDDFICKNNPHLQNRTLPPNTKVRGKIIFESTNNILKEGVVKLPDDITEKIQKIVPLIKNKEKEYNKFYHNHNILSKFGWTQSIFKFNPEIHYITTIKCINPYTQEKIEIPILIDFSQYDHSMVTRTTRVSRYGKFASQIFYNITKRKPYIVFFFNGHDYTTNLDIEDSLIHEITHIIDPKLKLISHKPKTYTKKLTGIPWDITKKEKEKTPEQRNYNYITSPVEFDAYMRQLFYRLEKNSQTTKNIKNYIENLEKPLRWPTYAFLQTLGGWVQMSPLFMQIENKPSLVKKLKKIYYQFIQDLKRKNHIKESYGSVLTPFRLPNVFVYNISGKVFSGEWHYLGTIIAKNMIEARKKFNKTSLGHQYWGDNVNFMYDADKTKKHKEQLLQQHKAKQNIELRRSQSMWWNSD